MDRREFLATAGVAVGAMAVGGVRAQPTAGAAAPKRAVRKAIMFGMFKPEPDAPLADRFKMLRDAGFEGVEMDGPSKTPHEEVLSAMASSGIKVHGIVDSVHWSDTLTHPSAEIRDRGLKGLEAAIRDCHAYSGVSVLLVPGVVNKDVSYDEAWERSTEQIKKALPLAEELKVKIAIENVWNNFLLSPLEAVRYVDQFNSPWVAWHFDVGNVIHYGWPEQWVRILGKRTAKLHIKEFSRKKANEEGLWKGFDVDLLDGDNGWPAVMKALDEVGYPGGPNGGWATAEVRGGDQKRMKEIAEKMDRIFAM
jgi:L-ribulose-5-phosphate 3-epimerase